MRLAQWRVTWISKVQCFYRAFVQADSSVLLSPPLRQAQKRYGQGYDDTTRQTKSGSF